jgi:hypothetical protein
MAGVEWLHETLDRAPFAGCIPPFEDDADRRSQLAVVELSTVDQAEVEEATLGDAQEFGLFVLGDPKGQIGIVQPCVVR